jgi:ribosomal protein L37E
VCPNCGYPHIEKDTTKFTIKEIEDFIMQPVTCPNCGTRAFPKEEYFCEECGKNAIRMNIFDIHLLIHKETQMSSDGKQTIVHIESGAVELNPKEEFGEMYAPLDLADLFKPDTLEMQSKKFDWDIPEEWLGNQPSGRTPVRDYRR